MDFYFSFVLSNSRLCEVILYYFAPSIISTIEISDEGKCAFKSGIFSRRVSNKNMKASVGVYVYAKCLFKNAIKTTLTIICFNTKLVKEREVGGVKHSPMTQMIQLTIA